MEYDERFLNKYLEKYGVTKEDVERVVSYAYYTDSMKVYVSGIMGGGVEQEPLLEQAVCAYTSRYFEYLKNYLENR